MDCKNSCKRGGFIEVKGDGRVIAMQLALIEEFPLVTWSCSLNLSLSLSNYRYLFAQNEQTIKELFPLSKDIMLSNGFAVINTEFERF